MVIICRFSIRPWGTQALPHRFIGLALFLTMSGPGLASLWFYKDALQPLPEQNRLRRSVEQVVFQPIRGLAVRSSCGTRI